MTSNSKNAETSPYNSHRSQDKRDKSSVHQTITSINNIGASQNQHESESFNVVEINVGTIFQEATSPSLNINSGDNTLNSKPSNLRGSFYSTQNSNHLMKPIATKMANVDDEYQVNEPKSKKTSQHHDSRRKITPFTARRILLHKEEIRLKQMASKITSTG